MVFLIHQGRSQDENSANRSLDQFKEGMIGKLVVRKSGRVQLLLGNTYLDVNMGTPNGFLQVCSYRITLILICLSVGILQHHLFGLL